jgi:hypothetical protein
MSLASSVVNKFADSGFFHGGMPKDLGTETKTPDAVKAHGAEAANKGILEHLKELIRGTTAGMMPKDIAKKTIKEQRHTDIATDIGRIVGKIKGEIDQLKERIHKGYEAGVEETKPFLAKKLTHQALLGLAGLGTAAAGLAYLLSRSKKKPRRGRR